MPKCSKESCKAEATLTIRLTLHNAADIGAEVFLRLPVCADHKMPNEDIKKLIEINWEGIAFGFEKHGYDRPVMEKTEFHWAPWNELEEFYEDFAKSAGIKHHEYKN